MTTYHPYKVNFSEGQKEKLARAYKTSSPITIRLTKNQTSGSDELMLTTTQINRINKAKSLGNVGSIFSRLRESGFQVLLPTTAGSLVRSACP